MDPNKSRNSVIEYFILLSIYTKNKLASYI